MSLHGNASQICLRKRTTCETLWELDFYGSLIEYVGSVRYYGTNIDETIMYCNINNGIIELSEKYKHAFLITLKHYFNFNQATSLSKKSI